MVAISGILCSCFAYLIIQMNETNLVNVICSTTSLYHVYRIASNFLSARPETVYTGLKHFLRGIPLTKASDAMWRYVDD